MITTVYLYTMAVSVALFLAAILSAVYVSRSKYKRRNRVKRMYEDIICGFLEPGADLSDLDFPHTDNFFNCSILLSMLSEMASMIQGVERKILTLAYRNSELPEYTLRVYEGNNPYQKIKSLAVFCDLEASRTSPASLGHYIYSDNNEERMFMLLAKLNMEPDKMIPIIRDYPYALSKRFCANIHSLINRSPVPVHDSGMLLESVNPSVANFGKKLMELFKVEDLNEATVIVEFDAYA